MTVDIDELQELVERVRLEVRMTEAAIIIQKAYRRFMKERLEAFKHKCAKKLQSQWRCFRLRQMRDRIM